MRDFKNLIFREFIIAFKNTKSLYSYCTFFFTSMLLFVFAIGPDISILSPIYKPILWMITIFSLILISESFVFEDFLDGSLSELQFLGYSEENIFLSKCLVMFISLIIPNIFLIPISSILFKINFLDVIEIIDSIYYFFTNYYFNFNTFSFIFIAGQKEQIYSIYFNHAFFIPIIIIATSKIFCNQFRK